MNHTLAIIKPDAVAKNVIGDIYNRFEKAGLRIVAARMLHLSREQAGEFYAVHKERPFYNDLVAYMTSGPVWPMALEREDAVPYLRQVMGATYGLLTFFSTGIGGALGPIIGGFIFDKTGSYKSGWIMNAVFLLIISLLILALKPNPKEG